MSSSCCGPQQSKPVPTGWIGLLTDVQSLLTILCGVFLAAALITGNHWVGYAGVACGSYFALTSAWESLRARRIDVNLLMVLAAAGAIVVGHVEDAVALLFLFSLSSTLESIAMAKTRSAIEGLVKLRPTQAVKVVEGREQVVPVEDLEIGDQIRVPPFESLPTDGTVVSGQSQIDQSAMTGESVPVEKRVGDSVLAGTQNLEGILLVSVSARVGDSTLDRIVELVQDAQENKASGERISQWFGQRYTLLVLAAFTASLLIRALVMHNTPSAALMTSLTLLVALSPCALVISTPASTLSALTWAARQGILIRGGSYIESAGHIDTVVLDKTGTLTEGKPRLHEICLCTEAHATVGGRCVDDETCWHGSGALSEPARRVLRAAAAAEQYSTHPIAEAIVSAAREFQVDVPEAIDHRVVPGLGVTAGVDGQTVSIGRMSFIERSGKVTDDFVRHTTALQAKGLMVALMAHGDTLAALGFQDSARAGAAELIRELRDLGVKEVRMLTGDNEETARAVATEVGIDSYSAGLMPEDKTATVGQVIDKGQSVMMVGDGINDAPALTRATVGVAMGGLGSDIALNSADVVLMRDRLGSIPELIRLGRRTNGIILANLLFATGVIAILTIASLFAKLPLPLAVVGHEGSTVVVILNGLRLLRGPVRSV